jgi:hypothetical protein
MLPAELIDERMTVIGVSLQNHPHIRLGLPDLFDPPLEDRDNLLARKPLPRPQCRRDQLPAFALIGMNRHLAVVMIKGIEQYQLLLAMGLIIGTVYI